MTRSCTLPVCPTQEKLWHLGPIVSDFHIFFQVISIKIPDLDIISLQAALCLNVKSLKTKFILQNTVY